MREGEEVKDLFVQDTKYWLTSHPRYVYDIFIY